MKIVVHENYTVLHILHDDETFCEVNPDVETVTEIVQKLVQLRDKLVRSLQSLLGEVSMFRC